MQNNKEGILNSSNFDIINFVNYLRKICETDIIINKFMSIRSTELIFKSSLYVLEDTGLIIKYYFQYKPEVDHDNHLIETSHSYLHIYGILQALFLQQDAIMNICKIFKILKKDDIINDYFKEIKDIRNSSIGHPANRKDSNKRESRIFISQTSVSLNNFQYLQVTNGNSKTVKVNISELLKKQNEAVEKLSELIAFTLQKESTLLNNET